MITKYRVTIEDEKGMDTKILSVLENDARFEGYKNISDVHKQRLTEIMEFFETYKRLEPHKWTQTKGWKDAKEAMEIVNYAINQFQKLVSE